MRSIGPQSTLQSPELSMDILNIVLKLRQLFQGHLVVLSGDIRIDSTIIANILASNFHFGLHNFLGSGTGFGKTPKNW